MQPQLIVTSDGSHSLKIDEIGETYHSVHGAIQESKHVFIDAGLNYFSDKEEINILEIGLGTALNAFFTFIENKKIKINYTAIEAYPLDLNLIEHFNYSEQLNATDIQEKFRLFHTCDWDKIIPFSNLFYFQKHHIKLQDCELNPNIDLVYFDAFAPRVQPEMWESSVFEKLYNKMNSKAILVTYCAKGEVKRTLKSVGFKVETLQGPPGKREMIRALKE